MNVSLINAESALEPLCRSYICAAFDVLRFQVLGDGGVRPMQLLWAVGVMSDHGPHFLGAWQVQEPKDAWWRAIAGDVHDRGIERLRIVIGPDPIEIQAAMAPCYRDTVVLPACAVLAHFAVDPTLFGHRHYVERAVGVVAALGPRLKRALVRHGPCANAAAAASLMRRSAERYIGRAWPEPCEPARARRSPAPLSTSAAAS